jgi:predicted RNA-binding Zn ribbon-like protein
MHTVVPAFDLSAGALCLDLINTRQGRADATPREDLADYHALVRFVLESEVIGADQAVALGALADADPTAAHTVLARARAFREGLHGLFSAGIADETPAETDLLAVNHELRAALAHVWMAPEDTGFRMTFGPDARDMAVPLWLAARSAFDLLRSPDLDRVRECANHDCGWLFLDLSRNRSRKWCDMNTCGNRAKVRRFREREAQH